MPTELMRASGRPASQTSSARNFNVVAIALTAALVALQLAGLAILERPHAHAMRSSFAHEAAVCPERPDAASAQIPSD